MGKNLAFESICDIHWIALQNHLSQKAPKVPGDKLPEDHVKCILVLGPEALTSKNDQTGHSRTLQELFCQSVWDTLRSKQKELPESSEGYSYSKIMEMLSDQYKDYTDSLYKDLFEKTYTIENLNSIFVEKLPYIPFPLIINTSPDHLLDIAFERAGITNKQFAFYNYQYNGSNPRVVSPTRDSPIIYNLFGSFEDPTTTVRTSSQLLDFVFSILSNPQRQIDETVYTGIGGAKHFVFLGFDYESWHLKILLRYFGITKTSAKLSYARPWKLENEETEQYFKNLFNVTFIESNAEEFIHQLYEECNKATSRVGLRSRQGNERSMKEEKAYIVRLVETKKIQEALEEWKRYMSIHSLSSQTVSNMIANWNTLVKNKVLYNNADHAALEKKFVGDVFILVEQDLG